MRRLALLLFAIAPAAAWAQTAVLDITLAEGRQRVVFGRNDCGDNILVTWTLTTLVQTCDLQIWLSEGNCQEQPGPTDLVIATRPNTFTETNATFNREVDELPLFVGADAGVACGDPGPDKTWNVCGSVEVTTNVTACDDIVSATPPLPRIRYDADAPPAPVITRAEGLDSAIAVTVDNIEIDDTNPATVIVVAQPVLDADAGTDPTGAQAERVERTTRTTPTTIRVGNLTNGTRFAITAQVRDEAENLSESSESTEAIPVLTSGFFRRYIDAGGSEDGGCSSGGGAALGAIGAAAGVWLAWRRRRKWR
jgi:hypothetical protein